MNFKLFRLILDSLNIIGLAKYRIVKPLQRFSPKNWPEQIITRRGIKWKLWYKDEDISRGMLYYGAFEPHSTKLLPRFAKTGMNCLDIGANTGYYTVLLSNLVQPQGKVISFEPNPIFFDRLKHHIEINKVENTVQTINAGLSNEEGILTLVQDGMNASFHEDALEGVWERKDKMKRHECPVYVLDDYWPELKIDRIDFVKMDIEGFEPNVLEGGKSVFNKYGPTFLIEYNPQIYLNLGTTFDSVLNHLESWNYNQFWIEDDPNKHYNLSEFKEFLKTRTFGNIICERV